MSCVRFYPDIIVATEISSINGFENNPDSITVSIGNCLAHQKFYANMGVPCTAFIGYEGKAWNKDDYNRYFRSLPQFFTLSEDGYGYIVDLEALKDDNQQIRYLKLLTQGTYSEKILKHLGLTEESKELNTAKEKSKGLVKTI